MLFLCDIAKVSKNIRDRSKIGFHANILLIIISCARESRDFHSTCEEPRDVSRKLQLTLCAIMAS